MVQLVGFTIEIYYEAQPCERQTVLLSPHFCFHYSRTPSFLIVLLSTSQILSDSSPDHAKKPCITLCNPHSSLWFDILVSIPFFHLHLLPQTPQTTYLSVNKQSVSFPKGFVAPTFFLHLSNKKISAFKTFLITYLLTYCMVQSPSSAASQEIPRISRNPKVHHRTHKRPPPVSILGQPNPVHIPTSHLLEIHPNIIHPSTPRSPQWSLSLQFPHQDPIHPPLLTHTRHMPSPSHSSRFYHPHNIG